MENVSQVRRTITVDVPAEMVNQIRRQVLVKMRKEVKVPGFRAGKVPEQILLQRYSHELNSQTTTEVIKSTYPQAVAQVQVAPLDQPQIDFEASAEMDNAFQYKAMIEVYPEVILNKCEGLELELEEDNYLFKEEYVEQELKRYQTYMTQLEPAEDGATLAKGYVARINFHGTVDGQDFEGNSAEDYVLDVGGKQLLDEFEDKIMGMQAGDTRQIQITYPADYMSDTLGGKTADFNVDVTELRHKIVPELNDDFAKEAGEFDTFDALKDDIKQRVQEYLKEKRHGALMESAMRKLVELHQDLEVPYKLVDLELGNMLEQLKEELKQRGQDIDTSGFDSKEFVNANLKEATDRARGYMLVGTITKVQNISVTDDELNAYFEKMSKQYQQPASQLRAEIEKVNKLEGVKSELVFEKSLDFVINNAKINKITAKKDDNS